MMTLFDIMSDTTSYPEFLSAVHFADRNVILVTVSSYISVIFYNVIPSLSPTDGICFPGSKNVCL